MNRVDQSVYYKAKNGSSWESRFYFWGRHRLSSLVCPDGPWGQPSILSNGCWRLFARKFDGQLNNQIHLISNTKYKSTPYIWFLAQWVIKLRKPITNKNVWNLEFLSSWAPMGEKYQKKKRKTDILTNHKNNWPPPRWILITKMEEN